MPKYVSKYAAEVRAKERAECEAFGARLTKLILSRGVSQSDLARQMWPGETTVDNRGYSSAKHRDRISMWCRGSARPTPLNMKHLCKTLRVKAEDLWPGYNWFVEEAEPVKAIPEQQRVVSFTPSPFEENEYHITSVNRLVSGETLMKIIAILGDADNEKAGKAGGMSQMVLAMLDKAKAQGKKLNISIN